jgi:hypothetical protein
VLSEENRINFTKLKYTPMRYAGYSLSEGLGTFAYLDPIVTKSCKNLWQNEDIVMNTYSQDLQLCMLLYNF